MNAYELAEFIETGGENIDRKELSNMLRQQADRIAELEKRSEPVAWGITDEYGDIYDCICPEEHDRHEGLYTVPLYTTPQTKPLSDEEINQLSGYHIEIEWFDEGEYGMEYNIYGVKELVRAVEERHGIK